ncbi:MAG: hypothetical protein WBD27_03155 [Pyrinomonadaceae bacterium]
MSKKSITALASLIIALASTTFAQSPTAAGTVRTLLTYEKQHDNARDMTFNQRNLNIYKKWITPELYRLFTVELAREKREAKLHPDDKPYFGDGMDFGPMKEYCKENGRVYKQQFSLRLAARSSKFTIVPAAFFYNKACGGGDPIIYRFKLVRRPSGWLIDDIDYGANGSLRRDLRRAGK